MKTAQTKQNQTITLLIIFLLLLFCINAIAEEKRISMIGVTMHGTSINKHAANAMPNKLTSDGFLVANPQLSFSKIDDNGIMTSAGFVFDCYNSPAIYYGKAKTYQVEDNLRLGYFMGVYARQFPIKEEFQMFRVGNYQIIPTPGLTAELKISKKGSLRMNTNYFITFIDIGWSF